MRIFLSASSLFALWLLMSGIYKPLVVWLGVASALVAVLVVQRMNKVDGHTLQASLKPLKMIAYFFWLLGEIAKSNVAVTRIILSRNMRLRQHLFKVPSTQSSELGAVTFANSITLTPGTITVEIEQDSFWVHAASYDESDLDALADMDARVTAVEMGQN